MYHRPNSGWKRSLRLIFSIDKVLHFLLPSSFFFKYVIYFNLLNSYHNVVGLKPVYHYSCFVNKATSAHDG